MAYELDAKYPTYRDRFHIPTHGSLNVASSHPHKEGVYFCGNSLGLMPKETRTALNRELDMWAAQGVEAHMHHEHVPWFHIDLPLVEPLADLVGAHSDEVAAMGSLTANLNGLMVSFYKPAGKRTKILFEKGAFPSDYCAFLNMVKLHGYDESHLVQVLPPEGHTYVPTETVLETIDAHADELALVCLPGIQYYTGQWFDMETITRHAHAKGAVVGWDLAHAVGNVPLALHDWDVDFAAWCSYKYLNAGPGAIAGIFVHNKFTKDLSQTNFPARLAGWWGNKAQERMKMYERFDPEPSALLFRQLNPSVLDCVALQASLNVFVQAGGIKVLREKSVALTDYMEKALWSSEFHLDHPAAPEKLGFTILTPKDKDARGAQLSLAFTPADADPAKDTMERVLAYLHSQAIICDARRPGVIRLAPTPLYNTFADVDTVVAAVNAALSSMR